METEGKPFKGRLGRLCRRLLLALLGVAMALAVVEAVLRAWVPRSRWTVVTAVRDWQTHERLGWVQKPSYQSESVRLHGGMVRFATNADGLQPAEVERQRQADVVRVMIFGDSAVVGRSVPEQDRLHHCLERALGERGVEAEVINAGVEGYSTDQSFLHMQELIPLYEPDVVIHGVCANDLSGNGRRTIAGLHKPRFRLVKGVLVHVPLRRAWPLRNLADWPISWLHKTAVFGFVRPAVAVLRARFGSFESRNLIGLNDELYYDPRAAERMDWALFAALLRRMKTVCVANKAEFGFYAAPDPLEVWAPFIEQRLDVQDVSVEQYDRYALERRLQAGGQKAGARFVPMIAEFVRRQDEGPFHLLPVDRHCNAAGYRLTAEILAEGLVEGSLREETGR